MKMVRLSLSLLVFFFSGVASGAVGVPTQELVFPYFVVGGGWECELTVLDQGVEPFDGVVRFYDFFGNPLPVSVNGAEPAVQVNFELTNKTAETFVLSGLPSQADGGHILVGPRDALGANGSISGLLTFRFKPAEEVLIQIGVPASPAFSGAHMLFNNTNGNRTALAILLPEETSVSISWYNEGGFFQQRFGLNSEQIGGRQVSAFVDEYFPETAGQRGFLKLEGFEPAHFLSLEQNGLVLSTASLFPGVVERNLTTTVGGTRNWTIRMLKTGESLFGIAEWGSGNSTYVSGCFVGGRIELTIHSSPSAGLDSNIVLLASDQGFLNVNGTAVSIANGNHSVESGTFEMTAESDVMF